MKKLKLSDYFKKSIPVENAEIRAELESLDEKIKSLRQFDLAFSNLQLDHDAAYRKIFRAEADSLAEVNERLLADHPEISPLDAENLRSKILDTRRPIAK